jgi:hypothetical protein
MVQVGLSYGLTSAETKELEGILEEVIKELLRGDAKYGPHPGPMRAFGALRNEFNELQTELEAENGTPKSIRAEARQVVAMGIKGMRDAWKG